MQNNADGEDFIGISEELLLTGPGQDTRCTCVEILDDDQTEDRLEKFGLRISGSSFITRDFVDVLIEDDEGTNRALICHISI